jgi:hypothetical protein
VLGSIPSAKSLTAIVVSGIICQLSEIFVYQSGIFFSAAKHLVIGGSFFVMTCAVVLFEEPVVKNFVMKVIRREKIE